MATKKTETTPTKDRRAGPTTNHKEETMGKAKVMSFTEALRARESLKKRLDRDPQYQALRLRGLAGLIRASEERLDEVTNLHEVCFFLASTVDDIAEALSPDVTTAPRKGVA